MKTQTSILLSLLTKNEMKRLATQVEETIAYAETAKPVSSFTAADLWNIQRQRKSLNNRRSYQI